MEGPVDARFWQLHMARLCIKQLLPLSFAEGDDFKFMLSRISPALPSSLHSRAICISIFELYQATKETMRTEIAHAQKASKALPMFHLNVELWTSKITSNKYLAIRISYVNPQFQYKSHILAVREHNPPQVLVRNVEHASDILLIWVSGVLSEFNLAPIDLLSSTTDARSDDVFHLCSEAIPATNRAEHKTYWDLCLPHILNRALAGAFGINEGGRSLNPEARAILKRVQVIVQAINRSSNNKTLFEEVQAAEQEAMMTGLASALRLVHDAPQRWAATLQLLERVLRLWNSLRLAFSQLCQPFAIDSDHEQLIELYSLMEPTAHLIRASQNGSRPGGVSAVVVLYWLRRSVLQDSKPLLIVDPAQDSSSIEPEFRPADRLQPLTVSTRKLLLLALKERFFEGYADIASAKRSYMLDMSTYLHPAYRKQPYIEVFLDGVCGGDVETAAAAIRRETKARVREMAIECARAVLEGSLAESAAAPASAPAHTPLLPHQSIDEQDTRQTLHGPHALRGSAATPKGSRPVLLARPQAVSSFWDDYVYDSDDAMAIAAQATPATLSMPPNASPRSILQYARDLVDRELERYSSGEDYFNMVRDMGSPLEKDAALMFWERYSPIYPYLSAVARDLWLHSLRR
eukprot:m.100911 g.100911  ORF g.100911 m.100911 type:complete len:634 (-) comp8767_c0_seq2:2005-3906(-)